jgi:hypothetical protein
MAWFEVTFMIEAEDSATFHREFDEERIAAALPGTLAYLATIEEKPTVAESVRATWRRLRRWH